MIGVYEIWIGPYYYQGSSNNMNRRCEKEHLVALKAGKHGNKKLQNVWNKYQTFEWQILVECETVEMALAYEQDYIDANIGLQYYCNLSEKAGAPPSQKGKPSHLKGYKHSDEARANMSASKKKPKSAAWKASRVATNERRRKLS